MIWIAVGAGLLAFFVWLGRASRTGAGASWRVAAGAAGVAGLIAAAAFAVRGLWAPAAVFAAGALTLAVLARRPPRPPRPGLEDMSEEEARALLGVAPEARAEEIQAAYVRLMRRVHPDAGGASGLAAKLNAARDRLLKP